MRLIRDVTPGGNIRVLMTNLLDARRYPAEQFGALYHRRWRVEEAFKRIKHRLRLEGPAGSPISPFSRTSPPRSWPTTSASCSAPKTEPPDAASRPNRTYAQGALKPISPAASWRSNTPETSYRPCSTPSHAHCRIQPERSYPRPRRVKPPADRLALQLAEQRCRVQSAHWHIPDIIIAIAAGRAEGGVEAKRPGAGT